MVELKSVDVYDPMNPSVIGYVDLIDGSTGIKVDGRLCICLRIHFRWTSSR